MVIALGFFDCVHIGHRSLIEKAKALAKNLGVKSAVLTFDDNFFTALDRDTKEIFTLSERLQILKDTGIDEIIVIKTDKDFFAQPGEAFLYGLLKRGVTGIIAGKDYRYGSAASCGTEDLYNYCRKNGVILEVAKTVMRDGKKVSSTDIRAAITRGDIKTANALLGREYSVSGAVVHGKGRGRTLGLPTANILAPEIKLLPLAGVYRTKTLIDGVLYDSLTNAGGQPTFGSGGTVIETLIKGYSGDLYGKDIEVKFIRRIRDIIKFESAEALKAQIMRDISEVL